MFKSMFPKYRYVLDEILELYYIEKRTMLFFWKYTYGPTFRIKQSVIEFVKKINNAN